MSEITPKFKIGDRIITTAAGNDSFWNSRTPLGTTVVIVELNHECYDGTGISLSYVLLLDFPEYPEQVLPYRLEDQMEHHWTHDTPLMRALREEL